MAEPTTNGAAAPDAVTLQVVHNRLETLMRLMLRTLEQLAGTAVGREAGDYSTAFLDAEGRIVAFGSAVITHLGHLVQVVPWIYENYGREKVREGDIFMSNDPYSGGAVHSNDVGCTAPVFVEGELVGWVFCDMHFADVGGMAPGSFSPNTIDIVAEAIRFPPIRIYAGGEYREDVVRAFINNTRVPTQIARDLSAEVGAIRYATEAIDQLVRQYGTTEFGEIVSGLQDFSEAMLRERLRSIPDGVYEWADYIEDGSLSEDVYRTLVRLTVVDDELYLDYRGSSPAAPALLNCARSGLLGGVMGPLIEQFAGGIPFNAGIIRPVHVRSERGSFIDAEHPAPVGLATGLGGWSVMDASLGAASLALEASGDDFLSRRAGAQAGAMFTVFIFSGASNQHGDYSVFLNMDGGAEGLGGMRELDGGRGNNVTLYGRIPSVEAHEATEPFLYLSREVWRDSAGAGTWRGGFGVKAAVVVWGEQSSEQSGTFLTGRNAVPTLGAYGGLPASGVVHGPFLETPVWERLEAGELLTAAEIEAAYGDKFESLPSKVAWEGRRYLRKGPGGEVFLMSHPGGGGYGDPLERDPEAVAHDVRERFVSTEAARGAYGVILTDDGAVDAAATTAERERARERRRSGAAPLSTDTGLTEGAALPAARTLIGAIAYGDGLSGCARCGEPICSADRNWRECCPSRRGNAAEALRDRGLGDGFTVHPNPHMELAEFFCAGCGASLSVELYKVGEPLRWDFRSLEQARERDGYAPDREYRDDPDAWIAF